MYYKLDWFSFTFPIGLLGEKDNENTLGIVLLGFHDHTAHRFLGVVTNALWQWSTPVGFYKNRIVCPKTGVAIQWSGGNPAALCTLSGAAVDYALRWMSTRDLALCARGRATRLDFAVDIEEDFTPEEFSSVRGETRHKTKGSFISESGSTCYIGSRSGERMARVYRYNPPHPRSNLLRAEVELKGDAAKIACDELTKAPLSMVCLMVHVPFAWQHSAWKPDAMDVSKLPARNYDKSGDNRLHWITSQVLPALKRMHEDGLINDYDGFDPSKWIAKP